jgi:hypothetical protein
VIKIAVFGGLATVAATLIENFTIAACFLVAISPFPLNIILIFVNNY